MFKFRLNRASYSSAMVMAALALFVLNSLGLPPGFLELALIAFGIPRLHDAGHSGHWLLGLFAGQGILIALAAWLGREWRGGSDIALFLSGTYWLAVIMVGALKGQPHRNRWGPAPRRGISLAR